jgi:threonine synthase
MPPSATRRWHRWCRAAPNSFVLELFHGPTLAFKDVAMQLIARLMDHVLAKRGERATIVGATSGDTGGAAIEAFAGRDRTDIFILFPEGRVSPVQQRQMTTSTASNVHALAIKGNFDDCQDMVKAMFNHTAFRDQVRLSGVNSINWARIMAQIVYYFTAAVSLGAPDRKVSFTVPTGNFGDIFAGYCAKRMGLPIETGGRHQRERHPGADFAHRPLRDARRDMPTTSPSMDIQISSNFERLLFDANDRDRRSRAPGDGRPQAIGRLRHCRTCAQGHPQGISCRPGQRATSQGNDPRRAGIETGYVLDPHTAVGVHVAGQDGEASVADDHARNRASREVPGCRKTSLWY